MTRGREGKYANTPLAQWLKRQIETRQMNKKEFAVLLAAIEGKGVSAADRQIGRWTFDGKPPTAATLLPRSRASLAAIFDDVPPGADASTFDRMDEALAAIAEVQRTLTALLEAVQQLPRDVPAPPATRQARP